MKKILLFCLLALLTVGCSKGDDEAMETNPDAVTVIESDDTSEHELRDFECRLEFNPDAKKWQLSFDRGRENPFGGGDEEGASIEVTNMKDEWKAFQNETVFVSGRYKKLRTEFYRRTTRSITFYSIEITRMMKKPELQSEPQ